MNFPAALRSADLSQIKTSYTTIPLRCSERRALRNRCCEAIGSMPSSTQSPSDVFVALYFIDPWILLLCIYIYNYNYIYVICPPKWTTGSQVDHVMWVNLATSPAGDSSSVSWHRWAKTLICIPNAKNRFLSKAMALRSRKKVWPSPTISTMWPPSDVI